MVDEERNIHAMASRFFLLIFLGFCVGRCCKDASPLRIEESGEFAVNIAVENTIPGTLLEEIPLIDEAFISSSDLTGYYWHMHRMTYPDSVYRRLTSWGDMIGRVFVVSVGEERMYWGLFLTDAFSSVWENPVIRLIPDESGTGIGIPRTITIDRAYPWFMGSEDEPDPRADERIYNALLKSGKLRL